MQVPARVPAGDAADLHDADAAAPAREPGPIANGSNYVLDADRALARGWVARARDNIAAIRLSKEIEAAGRAPTLDEQAQLLRFVGFGAHRARPELLSAARSDRVTATGGQRSAMISPRQ